MSKSRNIGPGDGSLNFTKTADPKVVIGKYGVPITFDEFEHANKNGYAWRTFDDYADYVGGWAKPIKDPIPIAPYYRAYGQKEPISGGDIAILLAKDDPNIRKAMSRNIAKEGEIPMFGPADADLIRGLITREKVQAASSNDPSYGLANAVANAKNNK